MITHLTGDATKPTIPGPKVICHIVNDLGKWGSGFVLALDKLNPVYGNAYRAGYTNFSLGQIQTLMYQSDLYVVNMFAQHGIISKANPKPVRYGMVAKCLIEVTKNFPSKIYTIHMPRIGAGLGGGSWKVIEELVEDILTDYQVYVYTLPA